MPLSKMVGCASLTYRMAGNALANDGAAELVAAAPGALSMSLTVSAR